jgi:hypothetical protein
MPTAQIAFNDLIRALEDQAQWEARAAQAKALLNEMLKSRKDADELGKLYDLRPVPKNEAGEPISPDDCHLPDDVVVKMLGREVLLTKAKLHALMYEHITAEKQLRSVKAQIRQVRGVWGGGRHCCSSCVLCVSHEPCVQPFPAALLL